MDLLWSQHQLDQLLAALPFQFAAAQLTKKSAKSDPRKRQTPPGKSRTGGRSAADQSTDE